MKTAKLQAVFRIRSRSGFSFTEVMFAVVILGIGFIMVAAMFPVAIQQSQATGDDAASASVARGAMNMIASTLRPEDYVLISPTYQSLPAVPPVWDKVKGNLISNSDPRYACTPLVSYDNTTGIAKVMILTMRNRNRSIYSAEDVATSSGGLVPQNVSILSVNPAGTEVEIKKDVGGGFAALAPGAILAIVSSGDLNGRLLKASDLLREDVSSATWSLMPGSDLADVGSSISTPLAAITVGRGLLDPTDPSKGFDGPAQGVGAYVTFIRAR